jgi:hypothetical protein
MPPRSPWVDYFATAIVAGSVLVVSAALGVLLWLAAALLVLR